MQATSGLGAAAAYALSKEGFYVVLGNFAFLSLFLLFTLINVVQMNLLFWYHMHALSYLLIWFGVRTLGY